MVQVMEVARGEASVVRGTHDARGEPDGAAAIFHRPSAAG
jgi:hypothetical protein